MGPTPLLKKSCCVSFAFPIVVRRVPWMEFDPWWINDTKNHHASGIREWEASAWCPWLLLSSTHCLSWDTDYCRFLIFRFSFLASPSMPSLQFGGIFYNVYTVTIFLVCMLHLLLGIGKLPHQKLKLLTFWSSSPLPACSNLPPPLIQILCNVRNQALS